MPPEFTGFNVARFQSLQVRSTGNAHNGDIQVAGLRRIFPHKPDGITLQVSVIK